MEYHVLLEYPLVQALLAHLAAGAMPNLQSLMFTIEYIDDKVDLKEWQEIYPLFRSSGLGFLRWPSLRMVRESKEEEYPRNPLRMFQEDLVMLKRLVRTVLDSVRQFRQSNTIVSENEPSPPFFYLLLDLNLGLVSESHKAIPDYQPIVHWQTGYVDPAYQEYLNRQHPQAYAKHCGMHG